LGTLHEHLFITPVRNVLYFDSSAKTPILAFYNKTN